MKLCLCPFFLFIIVLIILSPTPTFALKMPYVVYMGAHSHEPEISESDLLRVTETHLDLLGSFVGSRDVAKETMFYSYTRHINGFAAMLEDEEASHLANDPRVVSVFMDKGSSRLQTTRSWEFLGLEGTGRNNHDSIWRKARFGEDTIIGNVDTGVWPESESFSEEGMGPVPTRWKGTCQNDTVPHGVRCNRANNLEIGVINTGGDNGRKLIGARFFNKGHLAYLRANNLTIKDQDVVPIYTPRDIDGHGTHTLSTAAGNFVNNASVFGFGAGIAKGGSSRARVASYKVCWPTVQSYCCFGADVLAAFDAAIADGVDVISVSLVDTPIPLNEDATAIGSFHAAMKGIVVVSAAGNYGPSPSTVANVSPWQLTVGASTTDRDFVSWMELGNRHSLKGKSLAPKSLPHGKLYPIISARHAKFSNASSEDALLCENGTIDPKKANGKILVCLAEGEDSTNINKGEELALAGAVGMVLINDQYLGDLIDPLFHVLPTTHLTYSDGITLSTYIKSTEQPVAYFTPAVTQLNVKPAPVVAAFSSRGPNSIIPEMLKPDITAPGVNILAAYTEAQGPTEELFDKRRVKFNILSGTSMSCPHVAGVAGLLKTLHPHWSPAAIKSAIMTTASTVDNVMETILDSPSDSQADPFSYGAGHVQPNLAMDPGLVYDLTNEDYLNFLCSLKYSSKSVSQFTGKHFSCKKNFTITNFNYPSITVPNLNHSITVSRTLKNVGLPATYKASIQTPTGFISVVEPNVLTFDEIGQEKTFYLTLKKFETSSKDYVFGQLTWSDGTHSVRSPIVVKVV